MSDHDRQINSQHRTNSLHPRESIAFSWCDIRYAHWNHDRLSDVPVSGLCASESEYADGIMPMRPPTHAQLLKQANPSPPRQRGDYGRRWMRLAKMVKARQPMCADPFGVHAKDGIAVPGTQVDHIVPRNAGGADSFENLQNLCASCHSRKTVMHDGGFGNARRART